MTRPKNRAERRRRSVIAKELSDAKYRQRIVREETVYRRVTKKEILDGLEDESDK